jgi:hypothetical protein
MTKKQLEYLNGDFKKSIKPYITDIQNEWSQWLKSVGISDLYERIYFEDFGTRNDHFVLNVRDLVDIDDERKIRYEVYARAKEVFINSDYPE